MVPRRRNSFYLVRWLLGHLVAYLYWPRHLLDARAHDGVSRRRVGRRRKRLRDSVDHLRLLAGSKGLQHLGLGISRAARMLHGGVGRICYAHVGAVRQLVA